MKKVFITVVFVLLASFAFGRWIIEGMMWRETLYIDGIPYDCDITLTGKWEIEENIGFSRDLGMPKINQLPNGYWGLVNSLLGKFQSTEGDDYFIGIQRLRSATRKICIAIEYTSATEYVWYAFETVPATYP